MTKSIVDVVEPPFESLLKISDLERLLRVERRTISRLCRLGQLPPPLKLGGSNRWRRSDVAEAIDDLGRVSGRSEARIESYLIEP